MRYLAHFIFPHCCHDSVHAHNCRHWDEVETLSTTNHESCNILRLQSATDHISRLTGHICDRLHTRRVSAYILLSRRYHRCLTQRRDCLGRNLKVSSSPGPPSPRSPCPGHILHIRLQQPPVTSTTKHLISIPHLSFHPLHEHTVAAAGLLILFERSKPRITTKPSDPCHHGQAHQEPLGSPRHPHRRHISSRRRDPRLLLAQDPLGLHDKEPGWSSETFSDITDHQPSVGPDCIGMGVAVGAISENAPRLTQKHRSEDGAISSLRVGGHTVVSSHELRSLLSHRGRRLLLGVL